MRTPRFSRRTALTLPLLASLALAGVTLAGCAAEPAPKPAPKPAPQSESAPVPEDDQAAAHAAALLIVTLARGDEIALVDPAHAAGAGDAADTNIADTNIADATIAAPQAIATVTVGAAPWGVGVHESTAYVATAEGLATVDLARRERVSLVPYAHATAERATGEYRPGGLGLAVAPDGARVYVAVTAGDGAYFLEIYDTRSAEFVGSVAVGARPFDVLVAPDGTWAATVDHDSFTVTIVDAESFQATVHEIAPFGTEGGLASWEKPHYGAVGADGGIWLPYQGQVVVRLDPTTGQTTQVTSGANSHAHGTALAGRQLLTVGTGSFGNATGETNLSVLDLDTGTERTVALKVPHETVSVWRNADGREFAAVAGGNTRDAGWDGITLVALDDLSVREIKVPGYPQAIATFEPR